MFPASSVRPLKRPIVTAALAALLPLVSVFSTPARAQPGARENLDGIWEIVSVIEDGQLLSLEDIRRNLAREGRVEISGQKILFRAPDGAERALVFVVDPSKNPRTVDLGGTELLGDKGIYALEGDNLIICLGGHFEDERPRDFTSTAGSNRSLITLRRVASGSLRSTPPAPPRRVEEPPPPRRLNDDQVRAILIGTWGHQTESAAERTTFNDDGSFTSIRTYKRGLRRMLDQTDRSSGTWRIRNGVVTMNILASTEARRIGETLNFRITSMSDEEIIYIDTRTGTRKVEWKLR